MTDLFTTEEIAKLSAEIHIQLKELDAPRFLPQREYKLSLEVIVEKLKPKELPPKQCQSIEKAIGENAKSFLKRFKQAAYNDLCKKDGLLYQQWQNYGNLNDKEILENFGKILCLMGITGTTLQIVVVAIVVIVLHIGIKAICKEI